jgi:hypothetical protein
MPQGLSYSDFCGIWFNRGELMNQAIYIALSAHTYGSSLADVPPEIFLAAYDDEATAFEMWAATNNARSDAAAKQKPPGQQTHNILG